MTELPPCPHCGATKDGVYRNRHAFGWAQGFFGSDGQFLEMCIDRVGFADTQTLRCAKCDKVRRDVELVYPELVKGVYHKVEKRR